VVSSGSGAAGGFAVSIRVLLAGWLRVHSRSVGTFADAGSGEGGGMGAQRRRCLQERLADYSRHLIAKSLAASLGLFGGDTNG
jgi:hypothetical protein